MIFGARVKKKQSNSNFDAAWALTRSFEGPWDEKGDDEGHYFPQPSVPDDWYAPLPKPAKNKVGTGWGLTSQFLYDFVPGYQGANMPTKEVMQRLGDGNDDSSAKGIWKGTCWKWMRGDSIHNQKIANILFDCFVRAQGRSTKFATQLNLKCESITYEKLETRASDDVQGERTKKIWVFTDAIVNKLNTMAEMDIISKIKMVWGKKYEDTGTMCRFNAILQGKMLSDPVVQKACIVEGDKRRNAKKQTKNKFYDDAVTTRKILFFTQKGCVPCLQLKPTCEALARQNDFSFQEVDIRTDSGKILMAQYRVGATPEVVLIDGNITKQWGAADLSDDKLALYLSNLPIPVEPDPFDDGKPIVPPAQASSNGSLLIPLAVFA